MDQPTRIILSSAIVEDDAFESTLEQLNDREVQTQKMIDQFLREHISRFREQLSTGASVEISPLLQRELLQVVPHLQNKSLDLAPLLDAHTRDRQFLLQTNMPNVFRAFESRLEKIPVVVDSWRDQVRVWMASNFSENCQQNHPYTKGRILPTMPNEWARYEEQGNQKVHNQYEYIHMQDDHLLHFGMDNERAKSVGGVLSSRDSKWRLDASLLLPMIKDEDAPAGKGEYCLADDELLLYQFIDIKEDDSEANVKDVVSSSAE